MEKRLIIAMALSLLVLVVFQRMKPVQPVDVGTIAAVEGNKQELLTGSFAETTETEERQDFPSVQENLTEVQTDTHTFIFSDRGGALKKILLKKYTENNKSLVLLDLTQSASGLFSLKSNRAKGLDNKKYELILNNNIIQYKLVIENNIEITKTYNFQKEAEVITAVIETKNISSHSTGSDYTMIGPCSLEQSGQIVGRSFLEADALIDGKVWKVKALKQAQEKTGYITGVATKNRYFALILKPLTIPVAVRINPTLGKGLETEIKRQGEEIRPGETTVDEYLLYAGALDEKKITEISPDLAQIVEYGFFGGVSKVLLSVLRVFYRGTKNWGLAVIFLTILMNLVLFPLTIKSFSSMHKMKQVQPHMQRLKELHKDNPHKLNKEMMELYKKYNVNPVGGCLPLILQMPIFIALYQALIRSVELKGAAFLWIHDLATPDAVGLPFSLPVFGDHVNILPLLMVGVMVLQQKVSQRNLAGTTTEEQASQQKMMMLFMPLFFGFIFYKMPSGLVLYWLTNTILMTIEHGFLSKRMEQE
ncbi:MAG: membrane protein insertase YidC [Candidatus Omnitrophota bacterium]